ncbi:hypothetical protein ACFE04_028463 [Oxalis oulophora]
MCDNFNFWFDFILSAFSELRFGVPGTPTHILNLGLRLSSTSDCLGVLLASSSPQVLRPCRHCLRHPEKRCSWTRQSHDFGNCLPTKNSDFISALPTTMASMNSASSLGHVVQVDILDPVALAAMVGDSSPSVGNVDPEGNKLSFSPWPRPRFNWLRHRSRSRSSFNQGPIKKREISSWKGCGNHLPGYNLPDWEIRFISEIKLAIWLIGFNWLAVNCDEGFLQRLPTDHSSGNIGSQSLCLAVVLECILNVIRALRMGSCLSAESRSPAPSSPSSPALGVRKRKNSKKKLGSRNSSFDYRREEPLHRIPGRMHLNGSSEVASIFTQQGKKGTNQDAMLVWENFGSRTDTVFCGVFDGHGPYGHMVARKVRDHLPIKLSSHWETSVINEEVLKEITLNKPGSMNNNEDSSFFSADEESRALIQDDETEKQPAIFQLLKESFLKAFRVMDRELKIHSSIDCFCSGTTAVTLIKQGQDLVMGNVGDSRAVLGTRGKDDSLVAVQLTVDLKPNLPAEAERIRKCKGRVFALHDEPEVSRVWLPNNDSPGLAMARAFGDFCLKDFGLISVPEVSYRRLTDKDEFVVMATDGVWDVLTNKEVVDIVASSANRATAARALVESAVRAWRYKYPTSKVDDCAVVCLFFDSNSNNISTANIKSKDSVDQVDNGKDEDLSGAVRTDKEIVADDVSDEESSKLEDINSDVGIEWSALEGVSRVNTLLTLPRFVPGKEDKKAAAELRARK